MGIERYIDGTLVTTAESTGGLLRMDTTNYLGDIYSGGWRNTSDGVKEIAREAAHEAIREFIKAVSNDKLEIDQEAFEQYARKIMGIQAN